MEARKYTKQIEIWETTTVPDGFGGNTVTTALLRTVWSFVKTKNASFENENGQNDNLQKQVFVIRQNTNFTLSLKDNFIKYKNKAYNIDGIVEIGLDTIDLEITTTQRD
jgi:head-tail adaptor